MYTLITHKENKGGRIHELFKKFKKSSYERYKTSKRKFKLFREGL